MNLTGLDGKGIFSALILAILIIFTSRLEYLWGFVIFLLFGNYISMIRPVTKIKMKSFERVRSYKNVISNAIVPLMFALLDAPLGLIEKDVAYLGYLGALAAITADKFSSELGIFDKQVYTIIGGRRTIVGRSGGVSLYGTIAGAVGSMIISIFGILVFNINIPESLLIFIAGILGNILDSIAGYFEEKGIGSKETSNIIGAIGGGVGILLIHNLSSYLGLPIQYIILTMILMFYYLIFSQSMR